MDVLGLQRGESCVDDRDLLRAHVERPAGGAFARLVDRYVDMIYNSALRQVRDPAMAEDVTQAVFILLSRKAGRLQDRAVLGGWLLRVTRFAARDALKIEARRRRHEARAAALRPREAYVESEPVRSPLDEAMARLREGDRDTIVLRYFEERSTGDVAAALRISDPAARQRCSRAVAALRKEMRREGEGAERASVASLLGAAGCKGAASARLVHAAQLAGTGGKAAVAMGASYAIAHAAAKSLALSKGVAAATVAIAVGTAGAAYAVRRAVERPKPQQAVVAGDASVRVGGGVRTLTPLMLAIVQHDIAKADALMASGADVNALSTDGNNTAALLYVTPSYPRDSGLSLVKSLVEHGAKVNVQHGQWGYTALLPAVREHSVETVRYLLAHGADPTIGSKTGETPLHAARAGGDVEIATLLQAAGAK